MNTKTSRTFSHAFFLLTVFLFLSMLLQGCSTLPHQQYLIEETQLPLEEITISQVHDALLNEQTSCASLTKKYISRIWQVDLVTKLNSIIRINPNALSRAKALDEKLAQTKKLQPLHCIPVILKDNFDTADMPTEAGSIALQGSYPPDDAFMVKKLREAGAIIIAKSNMAEWAFSPNETISSTHGETRNAYDLTRVPAGSSGGTASAIAANFGIIGMGTDTGNSIRGPASHLSLVGIRSTIGLTSRDGVVPLLLNRDIAGPLTRTVEDAAKTFNVIAGYDAADPITHTLAPGSVVDYTNYLRKDGLQGIRLGVLRQMFDTSDADPEILTIMNKAIEDLASAGAQIIDPFSIKDYDKLRKATGFCSRFRYDLNNYLASLDQAAPVKTLGEIVNKKRFAERNEGAMQWAMKIPASVIPAQQEPPCVDVQGDPRRKALLEAVVQAMDNHQLDAIIYPSWSNPPRKLGDSKSPSGNNSPVIAPHTGQPAITVPMGFTKAGLPAGLQFLARPFDDAKLFQYAYAYEQKTMHRRPAVLKIISSD